jgi:malate dehydrogenase (oxaloacetate-decarboxylating)(NADP+)
VQAGTGIAEILSLEISRQGKHTLEEARKKIYLVDSKGLVTKSRFETLQEFKKPYAHEHEPCGNLVSAIKALKPTVLIGTSGRGGTFTKEALEEIASYQDVCTPSSSPLPPSLNKPKTVPNLFWICAPEFLNT